MKLSIITINYNGSGDTIKLLDSLRAQSDGDFDVIVVDNASEKADFENLHEAINVGTLPRRAPMLIRNEQNLGFSGGNNVGIRQSLENGAEWVFLLNNDTSVDSGFIERLKAILSQKTGIWGVTLEEGEHMAYCGKVLWLKPTLSHIYIDPKSQILNSKQIQNSKSETVLNLKNSNLDIVSDLDIRNSNFYAIGGAMAIHRDVFNNIGLLDEKYFLYFEDADFSLRARRFDFSLSFTDDATVHHRVSSTTRKLGNPLLLRYHYRNALYFNWHNGSRYIKILVFPWSMLIIGKQLTKILFLFHQEESRQIMAGVFDFWLGKMGKIK